jgi:hypothetical protein
MAENASDRRSTPDIDFEAYVVRRAAACVAPDVREKPDLSKRFNLICPVQSPRKKFPALPESQITGLSLAVTSPGGAYRDRHGRGMGCGGRRGAFDEQRVRRTAKSCGPDAPALASSFLGSKLPEQRR